MEITTVDRNSSPSDEHDLPADSEQQSSTSTLLPTIFFAIVTLVTILGNAMTIFAFVRVPGLCSKARNLWIISLACGDFIIGALILPLITLSTGYGRWPLGEAGCKFRLFFANFGITAGIVSITAVSVDNYLLMSRDYGKYLSIQAPGKTLREIAACWIGMVLYSTAELALWDVEPFARRQGIRFELECVSPVKRNAVAAILSFALFFFIPLIIMTVCSLRFLTLLRARLRKSQRPPSGNHRNVLGPQPKSKQSIKEISAGIPMLAIKPPEVETSKPLRQSEVHLLVPQTDATIHSSSSARETQTTGDGTETVCAKQESPTDSRLNGELSSNRTPAEIPTLRRGKRPVSLKGSTRSKDYGIDKRIRQRYIKPTVTLGLLLSVFAVCNLPYFIFSAVVSTFGCGGCDENTYKVTLSKLVFINSCLNPFLYVATNRKLRQFFQTRLYTRLCNITKCQF